MIYRKTWDDFKDLVSSRGLCIEIANDNDIFYKLYSYDGPQTLECSILKSNITDVTDFETNYSAYTNKNHKLRIIQNSGSDEYAFSPRGMSFTATAGQTTAHNKLIDAVISAKGGFIYCYNAAFGDYFKMSLVDIDNVLGFGANTVLKEYIKEWYVMPNQVMEIMGTGVSDFPVANLYIKIEYTSTGNTNVNVVANLFSLSRV